MYLAIIEACREVKKLFGEEQPVVAGTEANAPDLVRYRQTLEAGLNRLQGTWKETLGDDRD